MGIVKHSAMMIAGRYARVGAIRPLQGNCNAAHSFGPQRHRQQDCRASKPAPPGQYVLHAKAPPGNSLDRHTLAAAIESDEGITGLRHS
jgi:hypothetical protein